MNIKNDSFLAFINTLTPHLIFLILKDSNILMNVNFQYIFINNT